MEENLPEDPNDIYYITNCYACKAVAKPDQEYIRNYGGIVCFSCRAFFRRAYQNQTLGSFICKNGGKCSVTRENRRKCQKCRLERCLQAGMSHLAILTPEQKRARFRRLIKKQERQMQEMQLLKKDDPLLQEQPHQPQDHHQPHQPPQSHQPPQPPQPLEIQQPKSLQEDSDASSDMDTDSDNQSLATGKIVSYCQHLFNQLE